MMQPTRMEELKGENGSEWRNGAEARTICHSQFHHPASSASHQPAPWQTIQHLAEAEAAAAEIGFEVAAV